MSRHTEEFDRRYAKQQKKGMNTSKIFLDPKDEEETLNIFAEDGFFVEKASFWDLVTFRAADPMLVKHRLDYRWFRSKEDYVRYVSERTLAGWSHIWGNQSTGRQYWMCDTDRYGEPLGKREDALFPRKEILIGRRKRLLSQIIALIVIVAAWVSFLFAIFGVTWRAFWLWGDSPSLLQFPILFIKTGPLIAFVGFLVYYAILYVRAGKLIREANGNV